MSGKIYIESKPVESTGGIFDHTYLVYKDCDGNEWVIGGQPKGDPPTLDVYTGPLEGSPDERGEETAADRGSRELNLGGRDAAKVWTGMESNALDNYEGLPYIRAHQQ